MLFTNLSLSLQVRAGINPMRKDSQKVYISVGGDTETCDGDANTFQFAMKQNGGTHNGIFFVRPKNVERTFLDFCDSLPRTRDRTYVYWCHNLSFDLPVIFPRRTILFRDEEFAFESQGWEITGIYAHVVFCEMRKGDKHVMILDTSAYFKTSVAKLGQIFCPDLPKLVPPKDIGKRFFTAKDKRHVEYAIRDSVITEIVGQRIIDMHEKYGIPLSVSAPHMASRIFRRKFLQETILLPTTGAVYASLHAYHGGKNNFPVPKGFYTNVFCVDIKSAYPFAMSFLPSFSRRELYYRFNSGSRIPDIVPSFGVYKVSGVAKETKYPIIYNAAFKAIFGEVTDTWITGFELNQALRTKLFTMTKCEGYYYDAEQDKTPSPFAAYVDHFYVQKETAKDKGERDFYKLLLNSLYGKFVETRNVHTLLNVRYDVDSNETEFSLELIAGGLFNPFIASLITGHTRAYIHSLEFHLKSIHTSTDGIMTQASRRTLKPLLSEGLGGISIEAQGDALILRNKLYIIYTQNEKKAAKNKQGKPLRSSVRKGMFIAKYALHGFFGDVLLLEQMIRKGVREYEYVKVNKLKESFRRNLKINRFEKQKRKLNV